VSVKATKQKNYIQNWCKGCKRPAANLTLHGAAYPKTFDCSDLACPAQRHVQGMAITKKLAGDLGK